MIEARRRAYLEALGLDVWIARSPAAEGAWLGAGPGQGSTLLICASVVDSETEIAGDIARAIADDPVWAWLEPSTDADIQRLEDLIGNRLITRVLLFGSVPARALFPGEVPQVVGSATLSIAPALEELAASGIVRRDFWHQLRKLGGAPGVGGRT
jgi:hypothetical protein